MIGAALPSRLTRVVLGSRGRHHRTVRELIAPDPLPHTVPGPVSVSIDLRDAEARMPDAA